MSSYCNNFPDYHISQTRNVNTLHLLVAWDYASNWQASYLEWNRGIHITTWRYHAILQDFDFSFIWKHFQEYYCKPKNILEICNLKVITSVTVLKKWNDLRIFKQKSTTVLKRISQKMRAVYRGIKNTQNFQLTYNKSHWSIIIKEVIATCTMKWSER
jgi:hypothetical protein